MVLLTDGKELLPSRSKFRLAFLTAGCKSMSDYADSIAWLYALEVETMDLKLVRVAQALDLLGNPQDDFPSVHLAGTNGKGSTAAFIHSVLNAGGYRAGLFTSPHLVEFCERIRLGNRFVTRREVVEAISKIRPTLVSAGVELTPFEMITVLAFYVFSRQEVDVAIVEVGLGGRLDATNILSPLVSIVTSVGLDHQQYLGSTHADIAREKGGIIKRGVPVVVGQMDSQSSKVIQDIAARKNCRTVSYGLDFYSRGDAVSDFSYVGVESCYEGLCVGLKGCFQIRNASVALAAMECIKDRFPVPPSAVRRGLESVNFPGRFQCVSSDPLVILDGAHNIQALRTLIKEIEHRFHNKRIFFLFGVMKDKTWGPMLSAIEEVAHSVVFTAVDQPRAENPVRLQAAFSRDVESEVRYGAVLACKQMLTTVRSTDVLVVCGSLFLVGEVLPLFQSTDQSPLDCCDNFQTGQDN